MPTITPLDFTSELHVSKKFLFILFPTISLLCKTVPDTELTSIKYLLT
jgi:hypothetical protein